VNIIECPDYESLSAQAGALVVSEIRKKRDLLLCAATGRSPIGVYEHLVQASQADHALCDALRVVKLDEWMGIPEDDPGSCECYLRTRLLGPLAVPAGRYTAFTPTAPDPARECQRVQHELDRIGPIDLCILGLGTNGHLGFNEPGPFLTPHCHVARLSEETRRHSMVRSHAEKPQLGLTLGMRNILTARRVVLLVVGESKRQVVTELLSRKVTSALPASLLWLHGRADCFVVRDVLSASHARAQPPE